LGILRNANYKVFVASGVFLPVAIWLGIMLSHRIAGPWHRLEGILSGLVMGNFTAEVKLRKGDEFQSLADVVNRLARSLKSMANEDLEYLDSLDKKIASLRDALNNDPADLNCAKGLITDIEKVSAELKELVRKYKLKPDQT